MKKHLLFIFAVIVTNFVFGQWIPIPIGSATTDPVSMSSYGDAVTVGFDGDGIFQTTDLGNNWTDISGDIGNKHINQVIGGPETFLFVATDNGIFYNLGDNTYVNTTGSGLTTTDANLYFVGDSGTDNDFVVGTNGGGFFVGPELDGPWAAANNGLSGDALVINAMGGYSDNIDVYALATNGGIFYSMDNFGTWVDGNNGLSGDELKVTGVMVLNTITIITTHGGCFYSMDYGQSWTPTIVGEKFNLLHFYLDYQSGQATFFILGETSYYTVDLATWTPINTPGEVISATATSTDLFIGTAATGKTSGGIYRQPLETVTGVNDQGLETNTASLKQNYPNPFSTSTTISYSLEETQNVDMRVYDLLGCEIKSLVNSTQSPGNYEIQLNGSDLKNGMYYVVLKSNDKSSQIKVIKE